MQKGGGPSYGTPPETVPVLLRTRCGQIELTVATVGIDKHYTSKRLETNQPVRVVAIVAQKR